MTRLLISILLIAVFAFTGFGQSDDSLVISVWTPPSWFSGDKKLLHDNLKNYKFSKAQINQLVNNINTSSVLGVYYKYDPNVHSGLVPTIKIYIRQKKINDFDKFVLSIKNEIESVKSQVFNFKYIDSPKTILIGQRKAFYASSSYNLNIQTGEVANVRTKFVCIPMDERYLYVTLIDNERENCSDLFNEVIDKIKID